jgi:hypothetical protein
MNEQAVTLRLIDASLEIVQRSGLTIETYPQSGCEVDLSDPKLKEEFVERFERLMAANVPLVKPGEVKVIKGPLVEAAEAYLIGLFSRGEGYQGVPSERFERADPADPSDAELFIPCEECKGLIRKSEARTATRFGSGQTIKICPSCYERLR